MKAYLSSVTITVLMGSSTFGQTPPSRAAEASAAKIQEQIAEHKKHAEVGEKLFGKFKGGGEYDGPLAKKNPAEFAADDWGRVHFSLKAISKVSKTEYLVQPKYRNAPVMLLRGVDFSKVTDDTEFVYSHPIVIDDTFSYESASGAKRTVLVLNRDEKEVEKLAAVVRDAGIAAENALYREWTIDDQKLTAKYVDFQTPNVHLRAKSDNKLSEVPLVNFSAADQAFVVKELKNQVEKPNQKELDRLRGSVLLAGAESELAMKKEGLSQAEKEMVYTYVNRDQGKRIPNAATTKFLAATKSAEVKAWVAAEKKYISERDKSKAKPKK